ncbi:putative reverse transcriptase zinc-binding domain-containing protein [Helianthus annuus]|nr:putative reverse transcriptase zinc-binding domain-containing protein [Helianthus annuus]
MVGKGDKTLFWLDAWATNQPLKEEFPLLFGLAKNKRNKIQDNYKRSQEGILWDWSWCKLPNNSEEKSEYEGLKELLLQQSVGRNEDAWRWKNNMEKGYSVKEIRKELAGIIDVNAEPNGFEWSKIATAKVNLFTWRAIEERIPSSVALSSRGMQVGSVDCEICGLAPETANHIMIQCPIAKEVWLQLWSWMKIPIRDHNENMKIRIQEKTEWPRKKVNIIYAIHLLAAMEK